MRIAVLQCEFIDSPDINIVRLAVVCAIVRKFGVFDQDLTPPNAVRQNSILVMVEVDLAQSDSRALQPYSSTIHVRGDRTGKLYILDDRVIPFEHPDALVLRGSSRRINV